MKMHRFSKVLCLLLTVLMAAVIAFSVDPDRTVLAEDTSEPSGAGVPVMEIPYRNLSYSSELYVLYAVSYSNIETPREIKMLFWNEPQTDGYLIGSEAYSADVRRIETINSVQHAVFYSKGVAPKELVNNQYCRTYISIDGVDYYSEVIKYNPLKYIKDAIERGTEADVNLVEALRAYAAAAQIRFNYKTDDLATEDHFYLTLENAVLDDGFSYGIYKTGTVLELTAVLPEGDSVVKWVDGEGTVLGTEDTLEYTVTADAHVRAVRSSDADACEHEYGEWIEAADATCTEAGNLGHYHCEKCGRDFDAEHQIIDNVEIPALGHDWEEVEGKEPTCVAGWTEYLHCLRCGIKEGYTELEPVSDHTYTDEVVAPDGEARGYTNHVCSVCGDTYRSDYDYSLYSGVDFSNEGKFLLPYNIESSVYTIEAAIQLDPSVSARAGVVMGNYDGTNEGFNFEIYNGGKPRLYFAVGTGKNRKTYDYRFNTDIRSEQVLNLTITIERGIATLYIDGILTETVELDDFDIPSPGRSLVLGGDNRAGNSQSFQGTIYSASLFRDIRTEEEILEDVVLADASDPNCIFSYNLLDNSLLNNAVVLEDIQDYAQVTTVEELEYHAAHGTRNIEVMNDIVIDRTIYVISDVKLFSNSDVSLIRDPDFLGDMFVVGETATGRNLILDNIICILDLSKTDAEGTITIDGNKENVNGDVFGSLVFINCSGTLNINDGGVLTNNKKVANSRTLNMEQYFGSMAGGAAIMNINGTVNMRGGVISNNESNFDDPSGGDSSAENYLESCYGGAVFNNSNFVMTGGTIIGNSGYYGGAVANFLDCKILGGVIDGNFTSHAGGAIYVYNADGGRLLTIGTENGDPSSLIFRNNYTTSSSGGAVYSGAKCYTIIYGGVTFENNHTSGNGGAVCLGNLGEIGPGAVFTGNEAGTGGAVYISASASDIRTTKLTGVSFTGNTSRGSGGAVALSGAKTIITDCTITGNTAGNNGGGIYINRLSDGTGADVTISGGTISNNTAGAEGGALFADLNCKISVTDTEISSNSAVGNGGAVSLHGVNNLTLTNVELTGNSTGTSETGTAGNGGALYASYRTVTDNTDPDNPVQTRVESSVTVKNCTFEDNHSDGMGGAAMGIAYDNTAQVLYFENCTFTGNESNGHGGAAVISSSVGEFKDCTLTGNTSAANGGAIYCNSHATLNGSGNTFENNRSDNTNYGGGAIYLTGSTAVLSDSVFTGNSSNVNGGAIAAYTGSSVTLTDTEATGNSASNSGGFVYTYNSSLTVNATAGSRNVFGSLTDATLGNTAKSGGAIYADNGSNAQISDTDIGNNTSAGSGGALYFSAATGLISDCVISYNAGGAGGGDSYGGAMMVGYGSNVTVSDSSFAHNSSTTWGGAVYIRHKDASGSAEAVPSTLTLSGTTFSNNSAPLGGAVYVRENCTLTDENGLFESNTAGTSGGAIYGNSNSVINLSGTILRQNTSGNTGGAVYLNSKAKLNTSDNTFFDANTSVGIGGALYSNSGISVLTGTVFANNATTGSEAWYGGAIYTNGTSQLTVDGCSFNGNNAHIGTGGAICARGTGTLTVTDSTFTGNTAKSTGGAIHVFGITATIENTDFTGNSSNSNGGAVMVGKDANDGTFLTVTGGTFSGNSAAGGAAFCVKSGSRLDIVGSTLTGNSSNSNGGGAIYAEAGALVNITDAAISENSTTGSGGAIYFKENAEGNITGTVFSGNTASYGGAMIVYGGNVTLTGCTLQSNTASAGSGFGGAIYLRKGGSDEVGTVVSVESTFSSNSAGIGGAIYVNSGTVLTTTDSSFDQNVSNGGDGGGAVFVTSNATVDMTGGTVSGNISDKQGGAIYLNGSAHGEFTGVSFTENAGSTDSGNSWYGGAVYMNSTSTATVDSCVFTGNFNPTSGGAICVRGTGSLTVTDSEFNGNYSKLGGAIYAFETVTVTITDTTFTGNYSTSSTGGAIQAGMTSNTNITTLVLNGCTFTSNTAKTNGGAVYLYGTGTLTATGTDFVSNTASGTGGALYSYLDGSDTNVSLTECLFESNSATGNGGAIYHSAGSRMVWTDVTVRNNSTSARGDAVYVTNGSGKSTYFTINSATFDQPSRPAIDIGNNSAYLTVHQNYVTDVNHTPVDFTLLITGTLTHVTYVED